MTRWLMAARRSGTSDNTDKTDKTPGPAVKSVLSVKSETPKPESGAPFGRSVGGRPLTETGGIVPGSQPGQSLADALAAPPPPFARTPAAIDAVWDDAVDLARTIQNQTNQGD